MTTSGPHTVSHERAAELLPWLVNGTLPGEERAAVLEHARSCVACRRDLDHLENLRADLTAAARHQPVAPEPSLRRVEAVLREAKRGPIERLLPRSRGRGRSRLGPFGLAAQPLRLALLVQSGLVVALAAALVAVLTLPDRGPPAYTTLTSEEALPAGRFVRVVVHPDTSGSRVRELTERLGLAILEGPSERGVYTFAPLAASESAWRRSIDALENEPDVLFVQAIVVEDGP